MKRIDFLTARTRSLERSLAARQNRARKFRLFTVACCRLDIEAITDADCRALIDLAERFADGEVSADDVAALRENVYRWAAQQPAITVEPEEGQELGLLPGPVQDDDKRWIAIWGVPNGRADRPPGVRLPPPLPVPSAPCRHHRPAEVGRVLSRVAD